MRLPFGGSSRNLCGLQLPSFDIDLVLSAKAAKFLRVKPTERVAAEPVHFLAQWRLELAGDGGAGKWFLLTNSTTLYSILIPRERIRTLDLLAEQFIMRLRFVLLGATPPLEWKPGKIRPMRGENRALIGSMNNMAYLLSRFDTPFPIEPHRNEEEFLNETPFFAIPEIFPRKAFFNRLNATAGNSSDRL